MNLKEQIKEKKNIFLEKLLILSLVKKPKLTILDFIMNKSMKLTVLPNVLPGHSICESVMVSELPKWIKWSKVQGRYIIIKGLKNSIREEDNSLNTRKN